LNFKRWNVIQKFYIALSLILMMGAFQNCDMKSSHVTYDDNMVFSSTSCEGIVGEAYRRTYYSTFRNSCTTCHDSGGVSGRPFASANFSEAVSSFMSVGRKKIENNATNPGHKAPNTGPQHQPMVDAAQGIWNQAEGLPIAADCFQGDAIRTIEKRLPSTVYTTTPGNNAAWPRLSFDLRGELARPEDLPFVANLQVSVEVRRYRVANVDMGYEMKNPRAAVLGTDPTQKYRIKDIRIRKNNALVSDFTFFSEVDRVITGAAETLLLSANFAAINSPGEVFNTDAFALQFAKIETGPQLIVTGTGGGGSSGGGGGSTVTIPTRVTHTDLNSANQIVGVFNRFCVNCHRVGNEGGGLNLQDYTESFTLRQTIRSRMNNAANPMPPSGLIQDNGISLQVIDVWLSSGAPQN
jgi:mono/diheme cytochrome c family protein